MPRQAAIQVENNFRGGFVTEASGLNFPENACTATENCVFSFDGSVQRRLGFDYEPQYEEKTIARTDSVITSYTWKNVTGDGDTTLLVVQVGTTLYFYRTDGAAISAGALDTTINLNTYKANGAPAVGTREAQFADGNGFLFVTHPFCSPLRVEFDTDTETASATEITLEMRDFEGVEDDWELDERRRQKAGAANIDPEHLYNLLNQGWTKRVLNLGTFDNFIPSNTDIMYLFKNAADKFKIGNGDEDVDPDSIQRGNTPAPKGHFILTVWDKDRVRAMNHEDGKAQDLPSSHNEDTSYHRPSTCAFFAGRVFWAGLQYPDYNSKIYFTQIVERDDQYGQCYQKQDPTAESASDLLADDGGVISIPEAGTVYKLATVPGGLVVFAANGVWMVAGSTGLGFTAKDYTVTKVSSINAISPTSFVDIGGSVAWWNQEGIYVLMVNQQGPTIQSLTDQRIKKHYETIPLESKLNARGFFNITTGIVQWIYRTTDTNDLDTKYDFDRVLNFNMLTSAFYIWTLPVHSVKLHAVIVFPGTQGVTIYDNVYDQSAVLVTDDVTGEDVQVFKSISSPVSQAFKYLVSNGNSFSIAESRDSNYVDWFTYDGAGTDYLSYFISGYKLHGQAIRKFQANYVRFFSRNDVDTQYLVQGVWDFANTPSGTSRWSVPQKVTHSNAKFDNLSKRLKIRGHGLALQLRVRSLPGIPFDILGWAMLESGNQSP